VLSAQSSPSKRQGEILRAIQLNASLRYVNERNKSQHFKYIVELAQKKLAEFKQRYNEKIIQ
jgi:hypothetical protein